MLEVFFDISHLTTEQLREIYSSYHNLGWIDFEYGKLEIDNLNRKLLPDSEIIGNIENNNEFNYFVIMLDHEDEEDGIMIGFGQTFHEDLSVFLHLPIEILNELISKYKLEVKSSNKDDMTIEQYLIKRKSLMN